ncbi:hypothetical protein D3C81_1593810 [compost metagenome]
MHLVLQISSFADAVQVLEVLQELHLKGSNQSLLNCFAVTDARFAAMLVKKLVSLCLLLLLNQIDLTAHPTAVAVASGYPVKVLMTVPPH